MRYVALLRAVNVGGRNRVPMPVFRTLLEGLGHENVCTFIQSGNAVFSSQRIDAGVMEREIESALQRELGVETDAFIRSGEELSAIVEGNPFEDVTGLHVSFLSGRPAEDRVAALHPEQFEPDLLRLGDRVLYLVYAGGVHRSRMTQTGLDRRLGVTGTTRNWKTVNTLRALARS